MSPRWLFFPTPTSSGGDWDTYEVGAGVTAGYGSFQPAITFDSSYPMDAAYFDPKMTTSGYNSGGGSVFSSYANRLKMPAFFGIWVTATEAASGAFGKADTSGWYIYKKSADPNPGGDASQPYTPWACPTGCGNGSGNGLGLYNNGGAYNVARVMLSNYTDSAGEGGTDSWNDPPFTRQEITYTMDGSGGVSAVSNASGDAILYATAYTWPPFLHQNVSSANSFPRFRLGSFTSGFTASEVATLWDSLKIEYSINAGARTVLGSPVGISSNQTWYINSSDSFNNTSAFVAGDTIKFFLSDR